MNLVILRQSDDPPQHPVDNPIDTICLPIDLVEAASLSRSLLIDGFDFPLEGEVGDLGEAVRRLDTFVVDQVGLQRLASREQSVHARFGFLLHPAVQQHVAIQVLF